MGILRSCSLVSTVVWLHHFNKTPREKARWELHKDAACCFEQLLEAAPHITAAVWPLTSHLTNHSRHARYDGYCWRSKDELISDILLWTPTHGHTRVGRPAKTYMHLCRHWIPFRGLAKSNDRRGWRESKGIHAINIFS